MSEFIDREKAIANIKAAYCCGCENYNGVRCRACQIMDAMDVLEDEPAVVPDVQRWRKTAEEPPTEKRFCARKCSREVHGCDFCSISNVGHRGQCARSFHALDADA